MKRVLGVLSALTALVLLGVLSISAVAADPSNAKNAQALTATCSNGHTYDVVVNGNGALSPAHDVNSNAVLVPVWLQIVSGGQVVDTAAKPGKMKGLQSDIVTCTGKGVFVDPSGQKFEFTFTVKGFVTPRGH